MSVLRTNFAFWSCGACWPGGTSCTSHPGWASRTRQPHWSCEQPRARIMPQALQVWHCELHTSCAGRPGWACRTGSPRCRGRGRDPAGVSVRLVLLAVLRAFEPAGAFPRVCRSIRPVPAPGAEMGQSQVYRTGMAGHALVGWLAVHSAGEDDGWALSVSDGPAPPDKGRAAHLHLNVSLHATQHASALATPAVNIRLSGPDARSRTSPKEENLGVRRGRPPLTVGHGRDSRSFSRT